MEPTSLPKFLIGDQIRLKQVLINLTKNALKFTPKGEISIKASHDGGTNMLHVSVTDTGQGISAKNKEKLFKAFSKLHQKDTAIN